MPVGTEVDQGPAPGHIVLDGDPAVPANGAQQPLLFGACLLWSCGFFFLSSFFSSPNLRGRRLDVYHTSTHGVALVRI